MSTCNWRDCCNASVGGAAGQGAQALIAKWPIEVDEFTVSFLQVGSQVHKLWEASPTPMPFGVLLDFGTTGDIN